MTLKDFNLVKETEDAYEIKHPKGKSFVVSKNELNEKSHKMIKALSPLHMAQGGMADAGTAATPADSAQVVSNAVNDVPPTASTPPPPPAPTNAEPVDPLTQQMQSNDQISNQQLANTQNYINTLQSGNGQVSKAMQDYNSQVSNLDNPQDIIDSYRDKDDELIQKVQNQHIDPNRVWNNMSTGSKIGAGIAALLGGLGSGPTGKNLALQSMDDAINRDIDSQKNDQNNTLNQWKMNREAMGDDMQANLATKNQALSLLQAQISGATAKTGNAQAVLAGQQALTDIERQKEANRVHLALMQTSPNDNSGQGLIQMDPSMLVASSVPKEHQAAAFKEIADAQHIAQNKDQMMALWDQAAEENTVLKTGAGLIRTPGSIRALNALNDPLIHDEAGRVNEFEANDLKGVLPHPGDSESTLATNRAAYEQYITKKASGVINKGFNIPLNRFSSTAIPDSVASQTENFHGAPYRKVKGGWKKH